MLQPTKHYDELRKVLNLYWRDEEFESLVDCYAHILLDVMVYVDNTDRFYEAVRSAGGLAIKQYKKAMEKLAITVVIEDEDGDPAIAVLDTELRPEEDEDEDDEEDEP